MKINVRTADKISTFFVYCDVYLKKTFDETFFGGLYHTDYQNIFEKYKPILVENGFFSYLKDLIVRNKHFEENEDIINLNKNFENVNLLFWKKEYECFNTDKKFNIHVADRMLLQYFGFGLEENIDVVLVPKNSCNDLRMHSGVTNIREKNLIFIFVPEHKENVPYKRINLEVLIHEIIHLYIYRSEGYKKICTVAADNFSALAAKNKLDSICNELLARIFLTPNIFGLTRSAFNRNIIAELPLRDPLNIAANKILQEILDKKIETINDAFVEIFILHLKDLLTGKK